jgi:AraC-like DNA-binding protein
LSKTRQGRRRPGTATKRRFPDGSVWVRTYPLTYLHDRVERDQLHGWHQLSYAMRGHLEVETADARRLVPADRAVWVPAGTSHTLTMRAPVSVRSLYLAIGAVPARLDPTRCRTMEVSPLLRELVLHITRIGALDRRRPDHARLIAVLLDQLADAHDVKLELRTPRDERARRFAALVTERPGDPSPVGILARRVGASLRTLERCFLAETGLPVGEWRRRLRLFHALRLLEGGATVTDAAAAVGYESLSAFSAAFRRQFGAPPTHRARVRRDR